MKNKIIKKIAIIIIINIFLSIFFTTFCYAATGEIFYNGFKLIKRYNTPEKPVYWVAGLATWKSAEIVVPGITDDNIKITTIYDNTKTKGVFEGNIWLEKVDLSKSNIELIGWKSFYNCTNLTNYINSPHLKIINGNAFQNTNLKSLILNDGLEKINASAFEDAFSDENSVYVIDIPDTVTTIGENAFKVTDKNYRLILVGQKDSAVEEYCKTDLKCTFIERGGHIPTEEELIQQEIEQEKQQLFINPEFNYKIYNNTNTANATILFGIFASTLEADNWEYFSDILTVDDGFIVVGRSYLDRYNYDLSNYKEMIGSQIKGNDDAIMEKLKFLQRFESFAND